MLYLCMLNHYADNHAFSSSVVLELGSDWEQKMFENRVLPSMLQLCYTDSLMPGHSVRSVLEFSKDKISIL